MKTNLSRHEGDPGTISPSGSLPLRASASQREHSAFTLIEVLVASAILALMLVVFLSMSNYASLAWKGSQEKMEEFSTARVVMNRIRSDLESIVIRPDLPLFPIDTNDSSKSTLGFMTMKRGMTTDPRLLCYVQYSTNSSNQLIQESRPYSFATSDSPPFPDTNSTNSEPPAPNRPYNSSPLADGVVGFQVVYLNKNTANGTLLPSLTFNSSFSTNTNTVATASVAVRVSLAIVGNDGLKHLKDTGNLTNLAKTMQLTSSEATNATNSPEEQWNSKISTSDSANSGIDLKTARSLHTFERVIFLPESN